MVRDDQSGRKYPIWGISPEPGEEEEEEEEEKRSKAQFRCCGQAPAAVTNSMQTFGRAPETKNSPVGSANAAHPVGGVFRYRT